MKTVFLLMLFVLAANLFAQHSEGGYEYPKDKKVLQKIDEWQDLKFGLFMHWGIYSQWAIGESWSLCGEDMGWNPREKGRFGNYEHYKEDYRNLQKEFNPVDFNADKWLKAAKYAGMKYLVFTTKHHDGFCMFDTKTTDFKITSEKSPYHTNPNANITKTLFNMFKKEGFMVGTYFSKADWDSDDYWWPYFPTPDRHVNYNPAKYPERWGRFKKFTCTQIEELMTNFGEVDILWLDGGWVRPYDNIPKKFEGWAKKKDWNQDVDMESIVKMARKHQPGLIVVDRTVSGKYENYVTPEGSVPEHGMDVPWETCMSLSPDGWTYRINQKFRSAREMVFTLSDIVSKGGNLLLNLGPDDKGDWPEGAYESLRGIGDWMQVNSEAIYKSQVVKPYRDKNLRYTQNKYTKAVYAIYLDKQETNRLPAAIFLKDVNPVKGAKVKLLGNGSELNWEKVETGINVVIPKSIQDNLPCKHAWTLKISGIVN